MNLVRPTTHARESGYLNDLTHFLKLGDVTIRHGADQFELIEVKKGHKTSGRITRQRQNLRQTLALLDARELDVEEGRVVITDVPSLQRACSAT
jgi:hypothetical protein